MKHFTIAIDGPGGAGKSSIADGLAQSLKVLHLDTGAMYRALAYQALMEGVSTRDEAALAALLGHTRIDVTFENGVQHTFVNGEDVTDRIRTPEISMATSDIATCGAVRSHMVRLQQELARSRSMILDGRDIGTRVLPDATLKIFLTASPEVRARRRTDELLARGASVEYESVLADVIARDRQDSTRAIDPLTAAPDAVVLDTSAMTPDEVRQTILMRLERSMMQNAPAKQTREPLTLFYRLAMWLSIAMFNTLWPVRYHNAERLDMDAPFILIGNHQSMIDPLLIGWRCKRYQIRYLGKKELIRNPLMRAMYRNMRMIPVDRHNMDMQAVRACLKTLKENHVLGIFPEGTRHKKTLMQEMESGVAVIALRAGVPILPAYVTGKPRFLRPIDCYYGEPFSLEAYAQRGVNRETCDAVLGDITETYRAMAQAHTEAAKG